MKNSIKKINPAILVETFGELEKEVDALLPITNEFDIDLINWKRTNKQTLRPSEVIELNRYVLLNYDVMMDQPQETVELLIKSKTGKRITVNFESDIPVLPLVKAIKKAGLEAGISINPEGKAENAVKFFPYVDYIQIMTIEPGAQGNPFLASRLGLSMELRDLGYDGLIGVDGGVNFETIPVIKQYPIDLLSVGSSFSKAADPASIYKAMTDLLNS